MRLRTMLGCLVVFAMVGCATSEPKHSVVVVSPPPPPRAPAEDGADELRNDYVHLIPAATVDVLPCSMAVARVAPEAEDAPASGAASLAMAPANELVSWLELFEDTWQISEVVPITYPNYQDRQVETSTLLTQADQFGAGLCLIYHETVRPAVAAEIRGVIYDVHNGAALANIRADATAPPDPEEIPPPADRIAADRRHVDPIFVARDCFRELVRNCVLDWARHDGGHGAPGDQPVNTANSRREANRPVRLSSDRRP